MKEIPGFLYCLHYPEKCVFAEFGNARSIVQGFNANPCCGISMELKIDLNIRLLQHSGSACYIRELDKK